MRKLYIAPIPPNSGDSLITRRIKRLTEIHERNDITMADPFGQQYKYTAILKTETSIESTERLRDEELRIVFDTFAEALKDEVLQLARAIVIERKGLTG